MGKTRVSFLAIGLALGAVGLAAGIWWLTWLLSGPAGATGVHRDQNNSKNREHWSATYYTDWNNLQADNTRIKALFDASNAPGATEQDKMNLTGAVLNCTSDVATYNADAHNVLGEPSLPAGLPASVNVADYCDTTNLK